MLFYTVAMVSEIQYYQYHMGSVKQCPWYSDIH